MLTLEHKKGREGLIAMKLDIAKAYDRLEWDFILEVLQYFGFNSRSITLLRECICTMTYSVLLNGTHSGYIISSHDLRQGDPLSLFLFILGAEVLTQLIVRKEFQRCIRGIQVSQGGPRISHLMYADDVLLFACALHSDATTIRECLEDYMSCLGSSPIFLNLRWVSVLTPPSMLNKGFMKSSIFKTLLHLQNTWDYLSILE